MDKMILLCDMHKFMLEELQRRTVDALQHQRLIHLMLGPIQPFLSLNMSCQTDKGRHIIEHAAGLVRAGRFPTQQDIQRLLAMSHNIDQAFIARGAIMPVRYESQIHLIEPIRRQYIQSVLNESHQLLRQWQKLHGLRNALAQQYDVAQFGKLLYDMLHSIGLETRLLGQVANMPLLIRVTQESLSQTIYLTMDIVAHQLSSDMSRSLFRAEV